MSRSRAQQLRLEKEREILEKYFPRRVTWQNPTTLDTSVEIEMASNSNRRYRLRVYISCDFPNSCPDMVLVSPNLALRDGTALPSVSHSFHTIGVKDEHILLCHYVPTAWQENMTLYHVFMKGRLWIEGYEGHLDTGKDMDAFLKHQGQANAIANAEETTRSCALL